MSAATSVVVSAVKSMAWSVMDVDRQYMVSSVMLAIAASAALSAAASAAMSVAVSAAVFVATSAAMSAEILVELSLERYAVGISHQAQLVLKS